MVSIPSATTPSSRKKLDSAHMIQLVIELSRSASAAAAATTPTLASPAIQSTSPQPTIPTINMPLRRVSTTSMMLKIRISP